MDQVILLIPDHEILSRVVKIMHQLVDHDEQPKAGINVIHDLLQTDFDDVANVNYNQEC